MLKHKKLIIVLVSIVFFLTALTFYANKVLFPTLIKKIAIEQAEKFLNRKVDIESIHFNWVRGVLVDNVVVYQKEDPQEVFAQFKQLSLAVIFIPGLNEHTLSFPSITVEEPSIHFIRQNETTWNFSDLLNQPVEKKSAEEKPSNIKVALGVINVVDGKIRLDDKAHTPAWNELFDQINLKFSLAYNGITFDLAANIPQKKGYIAAKGKYMPLTTEAQAKVQLKNIDTASYLSLIAIKDLKLSQGVIDEINVDVNYSKEKISLTGDVDLNNFDVTYADYHAATSILAKNLDITYANGPITLKGDISTSALTFTFPQIHINAPKGVSARLNNVQINPTDMLIDASLKAKQLAIKYQDQYAFNGDINFDGIKVRKNKNDVQVVGSILGNSLDLTIPNQHIKLDSLSIKPLTVTLNDKSIINAQFDLQLDKLHVELPGQQVTVGTMSLTDLKTAITPEGTIQLTGKTTIDDYSVVIDKQLSATGSFTATKLLIKLSDNILKLSTDCEIRKNTIVLEGNKTISIAPQIELTAEIPLKDINAATYEGSITFSDAKVSGFPYTPVDGIGLDADFKTNSATINAVTFNILDTSFRAAGTVDNFKDPTIDIKAEANDINLGGIKTYIPEIFEQHGLNVSGNASLKLKFTGNVNKWQDADISSLITLSKVNASSSKANQSISDVTGIIEATPNSVAWRDFKGTYLGKSYTLTGKLNDFKNPKVTTTLDGAEVQLKANIAKEDTLVTINQLEGKYLNIAFGVTGTATVPPQGNPSINLNTTSTFRVEDIIQMLPLDQRKNLENLKLAGAMNLTAQVSGTPADWKNLKVDAVLECPQLSLMQFKIDTLKLQLAQADGKIDHLITDLVFYNGKVHAVASAELIPVNMPFELAVNVDNVNVAEVIKAVPLDKDIRGQLYLTAVTSGELTKFLDLQGKGSLAIREAYLADFDLLKGILEPLKLIIKDSNVIVSEVQSNFTIGEQKVNTNNLQLMGPTVNLQAIGWVSFDQNIDMRITAPDDLNQTTLMPFELRGIIDIDIKGKLASPKVKPNFSASTLMNVAGSKVVTQAVEGGLKLLQKIIP